MFNIAAEVKKKRLPVAVASVGTPLRVLVFSTHAAVLKYCPNVDIIFELS